MNYIKFSKHEFIFHSDKPSSDGIDMGLRTFGSVEGNKEADIYMYVPQTNRL